MRRLTIAAMVLALGGAVAMVAPNSAAAKDKGNQGKGNKAEWNAKPGVGNGGIPPGQIKRYTRGAKLPTNLKFEDIGDLSKWKLKPPGKGNRYIRVDNEILKVTDDMSTVVEAVGIVNDLLK